LSLKAVHIWVDKFSQGRSKVADEAEVAGTTLRRLLCYGFRRTGKEMNQSVSMLVEEMSRNKYSFQVEIPHALRFISIRDLFTGSPSFETFKLWHNGWEILPKKFLYRHLTRANLLN
jgi:hypothetical protein